MIAGVQVEEKTCGDCGAMGSVSAGFAATDVEGIGSGARLQAEQSRVESAKPKENNNLILRDLLMQTAIEI